ncbi:MAG TPA: alcohol dehydrogenase catalytic domain-containing protein [Thermoleophilaceae bacterium]
MPSLTYVGAQQLEWRDSPPRRLDGDDAALVRPIAVATCDLDALILRGASPFPAPFGIGHEGVAEVVEVGDRVTSFAPGQRVIVPFQVSCGTCAPCLDGRTGNCSTVPWSSTYGFGFGDAYWGGFLDDLVNVPYAEHMLVPLPAGVAPEAAASASDNIPDGFRTVSMLRDRWPGAPVLVVGGAGPGSIGLYAVGHAIALGAERVLYVDEDERRRAIAERLGAETLAELPDRLDERFPITVDASANPRGLELALRSTAADGICTSTGIYFDPEDAPRFPLFEMYVLNTTFVTGRVHARPVIPEVLHGIESGRLDPTQVTTRVVDWQDAPGALLERGWNKLVFSRA